MAMFACSWCEVYAMRRLLLLRVVCVMRCFFYLVSAGSPQYVCTHANSNAHHMSRVVAGFGCPFTEFASAQTNRIRMLLLNISKTVRINDRMREWSGACERASVHACVRVSVYIHVLGHRTTRAQQRVQIVYQCALVQHIKCIYTFGSRLAAGPSPFRSVLSFAVRLFAGFVVVVELLCCSFRWAPSSCTVLTNILLLSTIVYTLTRVSHGPFFPFVCSIFFGHTFLRSSGTCAAGGGKHSNSQLNRSVMGMRVCVLHTFTHVCAVEIR